MANQQDWNARYAAKPLVWSAGPNQLLAETVSALIESTLMKGVPGRALDLACGEGRNAIWLAEQGFAVTGIDYSDAGIEKARQIGHERHVDVDWIVADVSTFELAPGAFDLVAIVFLHTGATERDQWMTRAAAAVAPGGSLIYIGHDKRNIAEGVGGPQDPDVLPTADEICDYLRGFTVQRSEVVERSVASDPGHGGAATDGALALDTLVVATRAV